MSLLAFIDQEYDGLFLRSYLVPEHPKKNNQRYDIFKSRYTGVHISSYRRNKSHRCIATFKNKGGGPCIGNISQVNCSFLELDGSPDGSVKTRDDVFTKCRDFNFPTPSYVIQTSPGHFHVIWKYERPLPWNPKNERWWTAQQKRLIDGFRDFGPDGKACLNPVQFLRNPTQLNPYNWKRKCDVIIYTTPFKTSLAAIQKVLDNAGFHNPRIPAEQILRQFLRCHQNFTGTYKQWGELLGLSEGTMKRTVPKLIASGDMQRVEGYGNNKSQTRTNLYVSLIYLEPITNATETNTETKNNRFPEVSLERSKTSLSANAVLVREFCENGIRVGLRNKAIFACGLYEKWKSGGEIDFEQLYDILYAGFIKSGISEKEYIRTLKNVLKSRYVQPISVKKLIQWGLIESYDKHNIQVKTSPIGNRSIFIPKHPTRPENSNSKNAHYHNDVKCERLVRSNNINHDYRRGPPH